MSENKAAQQREAHWGALSDLPGNPLMWIFILSELLVFGGFFAAYGFARIGEREVFDASQALLDPLVGGLNTMVLLTSGLFAALAIEARARGSIARCRHWLFAAMALGAVFCTIKVIEYLQKFGAGLTPDTNTFFTYYYLLTGFHFAHVVYGLLILALVAWRASEANVETGVAFWHMVDLIWIILYPLIYLLR